MRVRFTGPAAAHRAIGVPAVGGLRSMITAISVNRPPPGILYISCISYIFFDYRLKKICKRIEKVFRRFKPIVDVEFWSEEY